VALESGVGKGAAAAAAGRGGMGAGGGGKVKSVTGRAGVIAAVGGGHVVRIMAGNIWLAPAERWWESRTGVVPTALALAVAPDVLSSNDLFGHHLGVAQWGCTAVVFFAFRYVHSSRAERVLGGSVTQP